MAEMPLIIVDVQRGGPSTGMPTNVEQSDLNIACFGGHGGSPSLSPLSRPHEGEEAAEQQESDSAAEAHHVHGDQGVMLSLGVVVVAEQEDSLGRRHGAALRRLEEAQANVGGGVLDAVEVTGNLALGREQVDGGGVRVLLLARVVVVLEPDRVGDLADLVLVTDEEVPALGVALGSGIALEHLRALARRGLGRVLGIDAHRDDVEFVSDVPRDLVERLHGRVEHQAAEHRARVIREDEERRTLPVEVVTELDGLAVAVPERRVARQRSPEVLDDVDAIEHGRLHVGDDGRGFRVLPRLRPDVAGPDREAHGHRGCDETPERGGDGALHGCLGA